VDGTTEVRRSALAAGVGLLVMAAVAVFANFLVLENLVTPGDAATTAKDVLASKGLFQWGIAGWFLIAALDVMVGWALFRALAPVDRRLSLAGAWARVLYGGVLMVATTQLVQGLGLLGDASSSNSAVQAQALNKFEAFTTIWHLGLILFGVHLLLVGLLAYRSGYMPKLVGAVVFVAGFGYLFDAALRALVQDPSFALSAITGMGEFVLGVWLVSKSHRISLPGTTRVDQLGTLTPSTTTGVRNRRGREVMENSNRSAGRVTTIRTRDRATDVAAVGGLLVVAAFQLSLALGGPFGRAALGGTHEGQLPTDLRVVSVLAAAMWALAAVVVMRRAGLRATPPASPLLRRGAWIVVGVLGFGALLNLASSSPWERFMWGPFTLILTGLCALVARSDPVPSDLRAIPKAP